eukprot:6206318-Pleurochrysis_carterae.AAC.4
MGCAKVMLCTQAWRHTLLVMAEEPNQHWTIASRKVTSLPAANDGEKKSLRISLITFGRFQNVTANEISSLARCRSELARICSGLARWGIGLARRLAPLSGAKRRASPMPQRASPEPVSYTHLRAHETDSYL